MFAHHIEIRTIRCIPHLSRSVTVAGSSIWRQWALGDSERHNLDRLFDRSYSDEVFPVIRQDSLNHFVHLTSEADKPAPIRQLLLKKMSKNAQTYGLCPFELLEETTRG